MKMLDTNVCSYLLRAQPRLAIVRMGSMPLDQLSVSALVAAELRFGAEVLPWQHDTTKQLRQLPSLSDSIERFLHDIAIRPWPITASTHYAHIRAALERAGRPIGGMDLLIAAHALAEDATLITNNVREFERVPNLRIEAWE